MRSGLERYSATSSLETSERLCEAVREIYSSRRAADQRSLRCIGAKLLELSRLQSQTEGLLRNAVWWWSGLGQRRRRPVRLWSRLQLRETSAVATSAAALRLATDVERPLLGSLLYLNAKARLAVLLWALAALGQGQVT